MQRLLLLVQLKSRDHIYRELGLEYLAEQRCSRKVIFISKVINGILLVYL